MKYFIDTEFDWSPIEGKIVPISIGMVSEDGRELYQINYSAIKTTEAIDRLSPFVREHVVPILGSDATNTVPLQGIAYDIKFLIGDDTPEFWGDCSAFDYIVLSMIMGDFSEWPATWPYFVNDLQQAGIPSCEADTPHHALSDARAVRNAWEIAQEQAA